MTELSPWDRDSFDFPLTPGSVALELGGYQGRWCSEIARRYAPRLYVYEPQIWCHEKLHQALAGSGAEVFPYGLGTEAGQYPMGEWGTDGCTFLGAGRKQGTGELREWYAEMAERGLDKIDLLLMNIEGYEFTLLPYIESWLPFVRFLMVQFHLGTGGDHTNEYAMIRERLDRERRVRFDYGPRLVCWEALP